MPARLVPLTEGAGPIITLQRPVVLIGRHPECDARIDLPQISRRHCCVALAYDRLMIRDLGSRNGVRVNGRVVEESALNAGDEVAIAQVIFRLEDLAPAPTRPPAAGAGSKPAAQTEKPSSLPELPAAPLESDDDDLIPLEDDLFPDA
jgi:predicted component of type VI protein secretion system